MGGVNGTPKTFCLDDLLVDLQAAYPGIEEIIEDAYAAACGSVDRGLSYEMVEPLLRHFIYQIGLTEALPGLCSSNGTLKLAEILPILKAGGVSLDPSHNMSCDDLKILVIAWVRRIQEEQQADLERWHRHLDSMQAQQERQLEAALQAFQTSYIGQIEAYHKSIAAEHAREESLRQEWEDNQEIQNEFFEEQQDYLTKMNRLAETTFAGRAHASTQIEFVNKVKGEISKINKKPLHGASRCFSYAHPVNLTSVGAPISGGFPLPSRKKKLTGRRD